MQYITPEGGEPGEPSAAPLVDEGRDPKKRISHLGMRNGRVFRYPCPEAF